MTDKKDKEDSNGIAPIRTIMKKMKKEHDKDPKGWSIIGSSDKHQNNDTFIQKAPNTYWLKSKMLSPYSSLSMGTVVRNIDKDIGENVGKKLTPNDMYRLFGMVVPINKEKQIMASGIEKYSQHHGNIIKKIVSEQDSNLGYSLEKRIEDEFTKKHTQRRNLYI